jgi:hypothetical protein
MRVARTFLCAMPYAETKAACEALRSEFTILLLLSEAAPSVNTETWVRTWICYIQENP